MGTALCLAWSVKPLFRFCLAHVLITLQPPDHPLAQHERIPLSELKEETFLLREPGSGTRSVTDKLFARCKGLPKSGLEFGSNETIKQAVMAGMGIALISAHTVNAELKEFRGRMEQDDWVGQAKELHFQKYGGGDL